MTEAELLELLTEGTANVLALVSIYFTVVSAYIAALWYFLKRAPFVMKSLAFIMLSGALLFLGFAAVGVERLLSGQFMALQAMEGRQAIPPANSETLYFGLDLMISQRYEYGVWLGWAVAALVYVSCFHLTFLHRWPEPEAQL